jgi:hypothetical protein
VTENESEKRGLLVIVSGPSGVGKTSVCFHLVRRGAEFLGDENTLVSGAGEVLSFPISVPVTTRTLRRVGLRPRLSVGQRLRLKLGDLVGFLSHGFLEKSLALQPEDHVTVAERARPAAVYILTRSPRPFAIEAVPAEQCARQLARINGFEQLRVGAYLDHYLVMNPDSALANAAARQDEALRALVADSHTFQVNLDGRDMAASLDALAAHVEGEA